MRSITTASWRPRPPSRPSTQAQQAAQNGGQNGQIPQHGQQPQPNGQPQQPQTSGPSFSLNEGSSEEEGEEAEAS